MHTATQKFPPLTEFMPHRAPMLWLDRMTACSDTDVVCEKTIAKDDFFVENGGMSSLVTLELFAQTAAAHFGYLALSKGGGMTSGALLGTRKLELFVDRLLVGDTLVVRARQIMSMPPVAQYECELIRERETIARGTINVAMGARREK
jgi:predicted hotdog family 3-hydroxylacyl-ACP dehydratase